MDRKKLIALILSVSVVGIAIVGTGFSLMEKSINQKNAMKMAENKPLNKKKNPEKKGKILYWQAPMDPTEIYDHPGKSKMGMDLIPVYEGQQKATTGTVKIDPTTVQDMGVKTIKVRRINFTHSIRTVGNITYNEKGLYTISTKISGWIEKLYISYTGQRVRKGEPVLQIYAPDLVTTQQEYLLALKTNKLIGAASSGSIRQRAQSLLESTRKRLLYWDVPASAVSALERTHIVKKTLRIDSPTNGIVIHKNAIDGMHIKEGQNLYQIADLSTVWVIASIYDYELPWVQNGQKAIVNLSYLPGRSFEGRVSYIYPYLDEKSKTIKVRLEIPNPTRELKPGMYANVRLESFVLKNVLAVPSNAIIRTGKRNLVFVEQGTGEFEHREVKIGAEGDGGMVRILGGILEGEKVVTSAEFMLDSESRLQEAIQKMFRQKQKEPKKSRSRQVEMNNM